MTSFIVCFNMSVHRVFTLSLSLVLLLRPLMTLRTLRRTKVHISTERLCE